MRQRDPSPSALGRVVRSRSRRGHHAHGIDAARESWPPRFCGPGCLGSGRHGLTAPVQDVVLHGCAHSERRVAAAVVKDPEVLK
jgi:hypothetical protein